MVLVGFGVFVGGIGVLLGVAVGGGRVGGSLTIWVVSALAPLAVALMLYEPLSPNERLIEQVPFALVVQEPIPAPSTAMSTETPETGFPPSVTVTEIVTICPMVDGLGDVSTEML